MDKSVFPNQFQEFIYVRTYSRWLDSEGRRERWDETVKRYCDFMKKSLGDKISDKEYKDVYEAILTFQVMPSMRALWSAGEAAEAENIAMYNCSFVCVERLKDFSEIMYILMNGTGAGFSVEKKYIQNLPRIKEKKGSSKVNKIVFRDSKRGWAEGFEEVTRCLWEGENFECDYSLLRPKGARLKKFGGRSSGKGPLVDLVNFTTELVERNRGSFLKSVEVHDICCKIAEIVVSGGVRRSSGISLSDLDDRQMAEAKMGNFYNSHSYRSLANNSAVYERKPEVTIFMDEWNNLIKSKSGERGIFNREAARLKAKENGRRDETQIQGINPCQPGWAKLLTPSGIKELKDIVVGDSIWSSEGWTEVINKVSSGIQEVYRYATSANVFYGTKKHKLISEGKKIEAQECLSIDSLLGTFDTNITLDTQDIMDGLVIGDGGVHKASGDLVGLYVGAKDQDYLKSEISPLMIKFRPGISPYFYEVLTTITPEELPKTFERKVPPRFLLGGRGKVVGFLRGLFTANGSVISDRVSLKSSSKILVEQVQMMLSSVGIVSRITVNKPSSVKFKNGEYLCRQSYDINITEANKFYKLIGFIQQYKMDKLKCNGMRVRHPKDNYDILSKEFISEEEVFDITVNNISHTYWTQGCNVSNCGEVLLRSKQMCNLTEVVVRPDDDFENLKRKIKIATTMGTWQSTFTNFKYIDPQWKKNCEEERLLGVSLTGCRDHKILGNVNDTAKKWLADLKHISIACNKKYSAKLKINQSAAVTLTKPSGSVSSLVDSSPGINYRKIQDSPYYLRRVRISATDPLFKMLKDQGVPYHCEVNQTPDTATTFVLDFPCKLPKGIKENKESSAIEQLDYWHMYRTFYTEHNPSYTCDIKEDEWLEVGAWVYKNFNEVSGLAFLPYDDHIYQLAPYEPITKEQYDEMVKTFPKIDFSKLSEYEKEDNTQGAKEYACVGGACSLV